MPDDQEWMVDEIVRHEWSGKQVKFWGDRFDQRTQRPSECDLRERALRSKPVWSSVTAMRAVPLVEKAAVDAEGYPLFPLLAPTNDDESDYGGSTTDVSGDKGDKVRRDIANKECIRLNDARLNWSTRPTPNVLPSPPAEAGPWGRLTFDSVARAKLIMQWWCAGCGKADTMIKHLVQVYGQYSLLCCPSGILYLMRHMHNRSAAFLLASTGDSTPISRRDSRTLITRNMRRNRAAARHAADSLTTMDTTATDLGLTGDDELMPPAPPAPSHTQSYIGFLPAPTDSSRDLLGPQATLSDVVAHYAQLPPAQWARGVRDDHGYWPVADAMAGVSPHVGDVMASRLVHYLSPPRDFDRSSIHHVHWRDMVLNAFSVPGLFERHIAIGGWVGRFVPLERYPFNTLNISLSDALQWVHAHGIPADSDASRVIHAYAALWRNMREGGTDSRNVDFAGAIPAEEDSEMCSAEEGEVPEGSENGDASVTPGGV
ncbi:hypothetical protein K438DRAFT_1761891 [Mycena galopus ATCC 62051]|nr:hypothetical protein K438DRAFT_1761891 [Mycena galopus ATCC 62051]